MKKKTAAKPLPAVPAAPANVLANLEQALSSGKWMFAVWSIDDRNEMHLNRTVMNFPKGDLDLAVRLLAENLQPLKAK